MQILIVDDEPNIRRTLRLALESMGHGVEEAASRGDALQWIERRAFDLVLIDLRLGDESGLDLLEPVMLQQPRLAVVVITAHASIDTAVEAMRRGAFDYLPKPFTPAQVRGVLERVTRVRGLRDRVADLEDQVRAEVPEAELASDDPRMGRVLELARRVAPTDAAVLIRGENGTGKGVLARALHAWSKRSDGPFVTVSCPSLSAELLESDLFGHARGAFTGAVRDAAGKVAAAEGGTLFLDEVGDLPPALQPKLLRFLQERKYERIGETRTRSADVRLVAATNRDLDAAVASGDFREDLFYRLNVVELTLPPLRRRTDILSLAEHLLALLRAPDRPPPDGLHARGAPGADPALLAGQPPRAPQRRRAGGDPRAGPRGRPGRLARADRSGRRRPGRALGDRRAGDPGATGSRAHPAGPGQLPQPRRRRADPRDRSEHSLSQAETTRPVSLDSRHSRGSRERPTTPARWWTTPVSVSMTRG